MRREEAKKWNYNDEEKLLEYTIEQALELDPELLKYLILKNAQILEKNIRLHESELEQLSPSIGIPYIKKRIEKIKEELEKERMLLEEYNKLNPKIFYTIKDIIEELKKNNEEVSNSLLKLKLRDIVGFNGDPGDKLAVFNYLIGVLKKMLPAISLAITIEKIPAKPVIQAPPSRSDNQALNVISISEKEFISMSMEDWRSLLDKCFKEGSQLELPENYLSEGLRRSLRNFLISTLELSPEKLKYVIPKKYKYIHSLHNIMFTLLVEGKSLEITPGSSDKEYIEGEGGLLDIAQAILENDQSTENIKRKIYVLKIGNVDYKLTKEVILENGRAKKIRYFSKK